MFYINSKISVLVIPVTVFFYKSEVQIALTFEIYCLVKDW